MTRKTCGLCLLVLAFVGCRAPVTVESLTLEVAGKDPAVGAARFYSASFKNWYKGTPSRFQQSLEFANRGIELFPEDATLHRMRATVHYDLGDLTNAKMDLNRSVELGSKVDFLVGNRYPMTDQEIQLLADSVRSGQGVSAHKLCWLYQRGSIERDDLVRCLRVAEYKPKTPELPGHAEHLNPSKLSITIDGVAYDSSWEVPKTFAHSDETSGIAGIQISRQIVAGWAGRLRRDFPRGMSVIFVPQGSVEEQPRQVVVLTEDYAPTRSRAAFLVSGSFGRSVLVERSIELSGGR